MRAPRLAAGARTMQTDSSEPKMSGVVRRGAQVALAALLACGACGRDCPPSSGGAAAIDAPVPGNPVQREMRALHGALQVTLTGIAMGDLRAVPAAFAAVDRAKEATEAALAAGAYVLARNPDRRAQFGELDESFHAALTPLVAAATHNDVPAAAEALGPVVRACAPCHTMFRR
jgi:hypothetical protein